MRKIYLLIALLALPIWAYADDSENGSFDVGVKAGTLGVGVEVNYPINSMLTVAVGVNKYTTNSNETTADIDYNADLNLQTVSVLVNFHPFSGSFRITAGAMLNGNEIKMEADPNATYDINGTLYTSDEVGILKGAVDFNNIAPYAGIGFGHSASSGFGFTLDIGVLMQGSPSVDLTSTGGTLSNDPNFLAELAKEEANAEDDIKEFTLYPVISAGVNYRF